MQLRAMNAVIRRSVIIIGLLSKVRRVATWLRVIVAKIERPADRPQREYHVKVMFSLHCSIQDSQFS